MTSSFVRVAASDRSNAAIRRADVAARRPALRSSGWLRLNSRSCVNAGSSVENGLFVWLRENGAAIVKLPPTRVGMMSEGLSDWNSCWASCSVLDVGVSVCWAEPLTRNTASNAASSSVTRSAAMAGEMSETRTSRLFSRAAARAASMVSGTTPAPASTTTARGSSGAGSASPAVSPDRGSSSGLMCLSRPSVPSNASSAGARSNGMAQPASKASGRAMAARRSNRDIKNSTRMPISRDATPRSGRAARP